MSGSMKRLAPWAALTLAAASLVGAAACGSPKMPEGPAPEYEDPHKPSFGDGSIEAPREVTPQTGTPASVIPDGGSPNP